MFKPDTKTAKPGDIIEFKREDVLLQGKVLPSSCKQSIIVDISKAQNLAELNNGYSTTVVAHKNYRVIG
ncbi:hypothetical protein CAI16_18910 [Virgibacillus dokdonensis]|uniref:DUF2187 family protein n=2 Tax=Virgibacillus TaxID=84406 RepID=A0A2K9J158_9BACI|nr:MULTISPECIES: DUF2187 family protein [Virgibacillus]AUJ25626.1 hypothetical protein A21D_02579 [Virgibacillus dokdonensis]NWO12161.1 DUF2187 family protein [Virgibacillus sp.]RFA32146.1 hypothetical protein CAI16_18910 [Virgibacillus dokdonensis]SHH02178.1 hypothetical protein SAMN05421807_103104 [Virgibacillus chiguensis]